MNEYINALYSDGLVDFPIHIDTIVMRLPIVFLFDLILYVPSKIFQLNRDGSSWVEQILS